LFIHNKIWQTFWQEKVMKIWNNDEVKSLFLEVEKCKEEKKPLKNAFDLHAKNFGRKPNSVRNYYYHDVENLKKDKKRCQKLQIDLTKHTKTHFTPFGENENLMLSKVGELVKQGESVRSACQKLSGGNLKLMTRLQNKYQNVRKSNVGNVIMFRKRHKVLDEQDINALLSGLVKLIKKTAVDDYVEKQAEEKENAAQLLQEAFLNLNKKERQYQELKKNFDIVKNENKRLTERVKNLHFGKNAKLKEHLSKKNLKRAVDT